MVDFSFVQPTKGRRAQRVAGSIKAAVSEIILLELNNPNAGLLTVTGVRMSRDLSIANIYVSCLGSPEDREPNLKFLKRNNRQVRRALGQRVPMKFVPEVRFFIDTTADAVQRIEDLLNHRNEPDK